MTIVGKIRRSGQPLTNGMKFDVDKIKRMLGEDGKGLMIRQCAKGEKQGCGRFQLLFDEGNKKWFEENRLHGVLVFFREWFPQHAKDMGDDFPGITSGICDRCFERMFPGSKK